MNIQYNEQWFTIVEILINIFKIALPIIIGSVFIMIKWDREIEKITTATEMSFHKRMMDRSGYFNYERIAEFLKRNGGEYLFGESCTPFIFLIAKLVFAVITVSLGLLVVQSFNNQFTIWILVLALLFAVFGFFIPDIIIYFFNSVDNEEMMMDIKAIFDTLKIQTKSGVYLSYSLCECYLIVENSRLKKALLDMTSHIVANNQIEEAVVEFNRKFENDYIDTLCITILQSLESGKSSQILDDLSQQIADMQRAINVKEREALDRRVQLFELLIFIAAILILVFVIFMNVSNTLMKF